MFGNGLNSLSSIDFCDMKIDENIEQLFNMIYKGRGADFNLLLKKIESNIEAIFLRGYLSFDTFKRMSKILQLSNGDDYTVTSENQENVIIVDQRDGIEKIQFRLIDLIEWYCETLISDSIFNRHLCEHYDYRGVMNLLYKISAQDRINVDVTKNDKKIINKIVVYPYIFYIKDHTLLRTKGEGCRIDEKIMKVSDDLLILDNNCLFVNDNNEKGVKVNIEDGTILRTYEGRIRDILSSSEILLEKEGVLYILSDKGRYRMGLDKEIAVLSNDKKTGVSWIAENTYQKAFMCYYNGKISFDQKGKIDLLWRYILSNAYEINLDKHYEFADFISLSRGFKSPMPFKKQKIMEQIQFIEEYLLKQKIIRKKASYANIMIAVLKGDMDSRDSIEELFDYYNLDDCDLEAMNIMLSAKLNASS